MTKYYTVKDIIQALGVEYLSNKLNVKRNTVNQWASRSMIPRRFHWKIATWRKSRELRINMTLLEELHRGKGAN